MIYAYSILNAITYIYDSFLINFTNNPTNKTGIAIKTTHKNIATISGATTFKRETIDNKKSITTIPIITDRIINTFFNISTPLQGDYIMSSTVLQIFSF